jgi:hypothetical protein
MSLAEDLADGRPGLVDDVMISIVGHSIHL